MSPDVPVSDVLLTEDRGVIHRRGTFDWPGGAGVITVHGVAPVLVDASVQAVAEGGKIGRVAVRRSWEGADTAALTEAARQRREEVERTRAALGRSTGRRTRAAALLKALADSIRESAGSGEGTVSGWAEDLAAVHARLLARAESAASADEAHREAAESLQKIVAAVNAADAKWRLRARVEVALDAPAGPVTLSLRYLVPAALWRPAYRAVLSEDSVSLTAQATVWQRTGEDWPAVPVTLSTARPATGATLPPLHTDHLGIRDKTAAERRTIQAQSWDQSISKADLTEDNDAGLPGVDDGGESRTLAAARPLAVPSTGRPHRAHISTGESAADVRFRCIPELAEAVFCEATLVNPLHHPLLPGPVTLITDGGTGGIGEIPFVAPGERFPISFGSQDDLSVRYFREVDIEERFGLSDYRWLIQRAEITNTGTEARTIELLLRVPVSELAQVKILLDRDRYSSAGLEGPDEQGFARFSVTIRPGETERRKVAFRVEKARNVQLGAFW